MLGWTYICYILVGYGMCVLYYNCFVEENQQVNEKYIVWSASVYIVNYSVVYFVIIQDFRTFSNLKRRNKIIFLLLILVGIKFICQSSI